MRMQAQFAYNSGNLEQSRDLYLNLLEKHPDDPSLWLEYGRVSFSRGDLLKVRKAARELRRLGQEKFAEHLEGLL